MIVFFFCSKLVEQFINLAYTNEEYLHTVAKLEIYTIYISVCIFWNVEVCCILVNFVNLKMWNGIVNLKLISYPLWFNENHRRKHHQIIPYCRSIFKYCKHVYTMLIHVHRNRFGPQFLGQCSEDPWLLRENQTDSLPTMCRLARLLHVIV